MLKIRIEGEEAFDQSTGQFIDIDPIDLVLEHSLVSISKWESKFQKPFLAPVDKTSEEVLAYVDCMIVSPENMENIVQQLSPIALQQINNYINSKESATTFGTLPERKGRGETITSELIYYWMVAFNIPFECENWHLNRLFALIQICNVKNSKPKRIPRNEIAARNRELNEQRKAQLNTKG
jgi:hypothetical protein